MRRALDSARARFGTLHRAVLQQKNRRPSNPQRTLEVAGVEFIAENGGGPGLRLRKRPRAKPGR